MAFMKKLLASPIFDDEEKTHHAYLLHTILLALIITPIPYLVYVLIQMPEESNKALAFITVSEIINIIPFIMLRSGYVRPASVILIATLWLFFTFISVTSAGVYGMAYLLGNGLVITIAGILLGGHGASIMTILAMVEGGVMVYAELHGWTPPDVLDDAIPTWIVSVVLFAVGAILQQLASRTLRTALARAKESEERYRLLSQVSSDYVFVTEVHKDGSADLSWVAGAFSKMTGYTYEEYVASGSWPAHVHPDDREKDAHDMEALHNNKDIKSEIRTFTKSGEIRWERIFAHPVWDEKENRLTGIIGAVQDVTQEKQAEKALRESEAIYRQAIEVAGAVPYHQSYLENGNVIYDFIGEGIRQITGYEPQEFDEKLWDSLVQERLLLEDLAGYSLAEAIERVRSGINPVWKCEHRIRDRNGNIHWVFEAAVELRDENGLSHSSVGLYQDITERKLSEDTLRYERDLLQIFMDNIPDMVYFKDVESRFVRINQAHAKLLNIDDPGSAIGKTDLDFQDPALAQKFMAEEKQILESGQAVLNRIESNPKIDGKPRWLSATKVPVKNSQGHAIGIIGVSRDVTEQRESQEKLQKISLQQAAILNNIPDMAWLKDLNSRYIAVNEQFAKTAGIKMDDIPGKTDFEIWQADFAEKYRNDDREVIQTRQRTNAEELQLDNEGNQYWVETTKTPILNAEGEVIGTTGIARDISERKKTERIEQQRRMMLEKVVKLGKQVTESDNLISTIKKIWHGIHDDLGFDRIGIYLYNPERISMDGTFGTSHSGEMIDEWHNWISLKEIKPESRAFLQVLEKPDTVYLTHSYENDYDPPAGHIMAGVKDFAAVAAWAGEKPVAAICVDNVITGRLIANEQVEALRLFAGYAGLAIENARLNSALQNELSQRKNFIVELEAKNAELERFTYTVSHDLKSPLVTIKGFLGYVEKDAYAGNFEKFKQDIYRIETAVEKMQNLLQDLLELSRIGRLMNAPVDVSFNEIVQAALEIVHGQLEAKKVIMEYQNNNVVLHCDPVRMIEVLQNLIDNAIKFMGSQPRPHIEIGSFINNNNENVVYVKDNGMGVAPEFHEKIFGLFNKLNTDSEGTGIGLSLVKRIIEVHGGRIWMESQVGIGTTFYFTILNR